MKKESIERTIGKNPPNSPKAVRDLAWIVRPSEFPFGVSRTVLDTITAPDRDTAQQLAESAHGKNVIVERASKALTDSDSAHNRFGGAR